jgi:Aerotolerance regulator N-terminal/von Willebrand factor type A domain
MSPVAGFANPWGALALATLGVLLWLHRRDRRRGVVTVSSLFLWRRVPAAPLERRRRLRIDPLLVARLAAMLALVATFVRPWVAGTAARVEAPAHVVVLDLSASMRTRERDGTRFDAARARAAALADAGGDTMLLVAGVRPRVALRWSADPMLVRRALETLEPLDLAAGLDAAVALALGEAGARPGTAVVVLTDEPPTASALGADELARVDWVQLGRSDDNAGIAALTVGAQALSELADTSATIEVRNWAHIPRTVRLDVRVGDRPWAERTLELPARGAATVRLDHPPAAGTLVARLDGGDAFAADDVARAWVPTRAPLDVLVVSDAPGALVELVRAVRGARVTTSTVAAYGGGGAAAGRVVVFDGVVPVAEPSTPALYVAPPPGSPRCGTSARVRDAAVIDWDDGHPLLRGLGSLASLVVAGASALADVPWGTAVAHAAADTRAFPFLLAGELDGRRTACLAAGPSSPIASTDQMSLVVLTLATLGWLQEGATAGATAPLVVRTGEVVPAPRGDADDASVRVAGEPPVLTVERVGAFHVGGRLVLASLLDPRESDVGRDGPNEWPASVAVGGAAGPRDAREIAGPLAALAAVLLALEWAVWLGRRA